MHIQDYVKDKIENKELIGEVSSESETFERKYLDQVYAVNVIFKSVSFKQAIIKNCYFRNCRFLDCDFTGAQFKETNLKGSTFSGCKFSYSIWDKTIVEEELLDDCIPSEENIARDLVRALRVNYSQIGNQSAVNKASALEVKLTGDHLYNAAYSLQSYYRKKYQGMNRVGHVIQHAWWKLLDLLWGNGESLLRVLVAGGAVIAVTGIYLYYSVPAFSIQIGLWRAFYGFWGVGVNKLAEDVALFLTIVRYVLFGLFMAVLVRKLSRR